MILAAISAVLAVWTSLTTTGEATATANKSRSSSETLARTQQDSYRRSVEQYRQQMIDRFEAKKASATRAYSSTTATNYAVYRNARKVQL